jgi:uncharacterized protein YgbK (DUF1537 family)
MCCARDGALIGLPLVTKSGGFGGDDSLVEVTRYLSQLVPGDSNL